MKKNTFVAGFCFVSILLFAGVGQAVKDGPFPMRQAIGDWQTGDGKGLRVHIASGELSPKVSAVEVTVVLSNQKGQPIAVGTTLHKMTARDLHMYMKLSGVEGSLYLVIRPVYHARRRGEQPTFDLIMTLKPMAGVPGLNYYLLKFAQESKH